MRTVHLLAPLALVLALACGQDPAKVTLTPAKADLFDAGGNVQLTAAVADKKGEAIAGAEVTFASENPSVAEVDAKGKVTAKGSGDTEIVATCGEVKGSAKVSVRIVTSLQLAMAADGDVVAAGAANSTYALRVTSTNENREPADLTKATWASSDPKVATVAPGGVLTLLSPGRTVVSVKMGKTKAELPVTVELLVPLAVKIDTPPPALKVGESAPLSFTVLSNRGGAMTVQATFTSSDPEVVAVDDRGVITGVRRGAAQVTIRAGEGYNTVPVTVR